MAKQYFSHAIADHLNLNMEKKKTISKTFEINPFSQTKKLHEKLGSFLCCKLFNGKKETKKKMEFKCSTMRFTLFVSKIFKLAIFIHKRLPLMNTGEKWNLKPLN